MLLNAFTDIEKDPCIATQVSKMGLKVERFLATLDTELDLTDCLNKSEGLSGDGFTLKYLDVKGRILMKVASINTDMQAFDTVSSLNFAKQGPLISNEKTDVFSIIYHSDFNYHYEVSTNNSSTSSTVRNINALTSDDAKSCIIKKDGDIWEHLACSRYSIAKASEANLGISKLDDLDASSYLSNSNDYFHARYKRLIGSQNDRYYNEGRMYFTQDNWEGEMTFSDKGKRRLWGATGPGKSAKGVFNFSERDANE